MWDVMAALVGGMVGGVAFQWLRSRGNAAPASYVVKRESDPVVLAWARWAVLQGRQHKLDPESLLLEKYCACSAGSDTAKRLSRAIEAIPQVRRDVDAEIEVAKLDQQLAQLK